MITIIKGAKANVIAIEIIDGYKHEDERSLEKMFEQRLDSGIEKVNMLVKLDKLSITKSSWKAMWDDGIYAMKHIKYCGKVAIVGDSKLEELMVKADNLMFGSEKAGREEKFFSKQELDMALEWANGDEF
jgi:hypothetical protein